MRVDGWRCGEFVVIGVEAVTVLNTLASSFFALIKSCNIVVPKELPVDGLTDAKNGLCFAGYGFFCGSVSESFETSSIGLTTYGAYLILISSADFP